MKYEMAPEQRKVIAWLNSQPGRRWSMQRHQQTDDQVEWLELKCDLECLWTGDAQQDSLGDVVDVDLGWYDRRGRYHRGPRDSSYTAYGKPPE